MKKSFSLTALTLALMLLACVSYSAAEFNPALLGLGGKIGFNLANVTSHPKNPENHTGYVVGGICNYPMTRVFDFQMEILFTGKGYAIPNVSATSDTITGTVTATSLLGYVEIPMLIKMKVPSAGKYRPYLTAGGYAALLLRHKLRVFDGLFTIDNDLGGTNGLDVGGIGGIGIDLKSGPGWVFFEIRYEQGLMSVLKDTNYKNRLFSFQAGYWF